MNKLKNILIAIAVLAVALLIGYLLGRQHCKTITQVQRDTTTIVETLVVDKPVPYVVYVRDSILIPIRDTISVNDTVFQALPLEVKEYKDSTYFARVSGYQPNLEFIEVYNTRQTIVEKYPARKIALGAYVGIGMQYGAIHKTFDIGPQMGVGLQYRF